MTTQSTYVGEKFEELQLTEDFTPILNRRGQAKLAFIEAIPSIIEKNEDEYARLQFRFLCDGVKGSQVISFTGWLSNAFSRNSKLGMILEAMTIIEFPKSEKEIIEEFDFEAEFRQKQASKTLSFEDLMKKLEDFEGTLVLAELTCENGIWHRPDPKTFVFPKKPSGEFYKTDVSQQKRN